MKFNNEIPETDLESKSEKKNIYRQISSILYIHTETKKQKQQLKSSKGKVERKRREIIFEKRK